MAAQDPLISCDHPARQMAQALRNSAGPLALGPQRLPLDRRPVTGCVALACGRGVLSTTPTYTREALGATALLRPCA